MCAPFIRNKMFSKHNMGPPSVVTSIEWWLHHPVTTVTQNSKQM